MRTDQNISHFIRTINGWAFMQGKRPLDPTVGGRDHNRIKRLLHEPKRLRL